MHKANQQYDFVISGGGPVGLFLGILLSQNDFSVQILEKQKELHSHSKSIGIHPPSLEYFQKMGLIDEFLQAGRRIVKGHAFTGANEKVGTLDFSTCKPPFNFILAVPQFKTEMILEKAFRKCKNSRLLRGAEVLDFKIKDEVQISYLLEEQTHDVNSRFLIAADGKHSLIRKKCGVAFHGKPYKSRYAMGDFDDTTPFEFDAAIYACKKGLVECFPLPNGKRRWVLQLPEDLPEVDIPQFTNLISKYTGIHPEPESNVMFSNFRAEQFLSEKLVHKIVIILGDAAHIVSPIGGQGMNLGWMDAWDLVLLFKDYNQQTLERDLTKFEKKRLQAAKKATKRAEFNMRVGHRNRFALIQKMMLWAILNTPAKHIMARRFTMRGL